MVPLTPESEKEREGGEWESERMIASSDLTSKRKSHAGQKKKKGDKSTVPASSAGPKMAAEDAAASAGHKPGAEDAAKEQNSGFVRTKALSEDKILESAPKTLKQKALLFLTNKYEP